MITTRDLQIIDFVTEFKIACTSTIAEVFFPSHISCYRRLQEIIKYGELKRTRDSLNNEYLYFKKRPKQLRHSLLVSDFYRELHKKSEIIEFKIEPTLGDIRPDALFGYKVNGKNYLGLLEVEISNKGFNHNKYSRFFMSENYKNFFPVMPTVFVVGDRIKLPEQRLIQYRIINTDFSNFNII